MKSGMGREAQEAQLQPREHEDADHEAEGDHASANAHHDIARVAAEGVEGADGALPHAAAIQQSFGSGVDVSSIKASVGGKGAAAANQLGAQAYASGDRVAFGGAPDLHTAAHEAAHVVQNRAGAGPARANNGALTKPGDAHEQHADQVADRVVRGESAAPLLAAAPAGAGAVARKPAVKDPRAVAKAEVLAQLDKGITDPAKLARQIPMLDRPTRVEIRDKRMGVIEAACSPAQVLAIQDAVENTPVNVLRAALRMDAKPAELAGELGRLGTSDLRQLTAGEVTKLSGKLKGPPRAYNSSLDLTQLEIVEHAPKLVRWIVTSATSANELVRQLPSNQLEALAHTFDVERLWDWTNQLTPAGLNIDHTNRLLDLLPHTTGDVHKRLKDVLDKAATMPAKLHSLNDKDIAEGRAELAAEQKAATAKLTGMLARAQPLKGDELVELAGHAGWEARQAVADPRTRKRVAGALSAEQAIAFATAISLSSTEALGLLLDVKGVSAPQVVQALHVTNPDKIWVTDPAIVHRVLTILGDDVSLLTATDSSAAVQQAALTNKELLGSLVDKASAKLVLRFATAGEDAASIEAACVAIATRRGYDWVYELVDSSNADSQDIHRLALACPNKDARTHLAKYGLQDPPLPKGITTESVAPDAANYTPPNEQLAADVKAKDGAAVANDAAELTDRERDAIRKKPTSVSEAIRSAAESAKWADAIRVARDLHATLAETMRALAPVQGIDKSAVRTFASERPAAEQLEVAKTLELATIGERVLGYSPLHSLPTIAEPTALATALASNPALVSWIGRTTSAAEAILLLGANDAVAAATAKAIERTQDLVLVQGIPAKGATASQVGALGRIGQHATTAVLRDATVRTGDATADNDGRSFGARLDELKAKAHTSQEVQALCSAAAIPDVKRVLADTARVDRIQFLQTLIVSPFTVFPWLRSEPATSWGAPIVFGWILRTEEAVGLLRSIGSAPAAIVAIAKLLDQKDFGATTWMDNLPSGFGLAPADEAVLYQLFRAVSDVVALDVFAKRFGRRPEGVWKRDEIDTVWTTLGRLPDRQVAGNDQFQHLKREEPETAGASAEYQPGTKSVGIGEHPSSDMRYANEKPRTKKDLMTALGIDEKEVERRVADGRLVAQEVAGVTMYQTKSVDAVGLTDNLLHEMGHAVDAMLGGQTDLVFGKGGWKTYAAGEFAAWAKEMDAWSGATVSDDDKAEIKDLFEQRLKSDTSIAGPMSPVATMAPATNALRTAKNANASIAKQAKTQSFNYQLPVQHGSRMFFMNHHYGQFMSYDAKIHNILPLPYAGYAPGEFFAECYVEYYRSPKTLGGNLPGWIKAWFDANVDSLGHKPAKKG